jgi:SAM-dependent methyltransferase
MERFEADWNFIWQNMSEGMAKNPARSFRFDQIEKLISPTAGISILDFGCGTGELVSRLERQFPANSFYAADTSSEAIAITKARVPNVKVGLIELTPDGPRMTFIDCSFDLIIISEVLEHILDHLDTLKMLFSILKPDGIIICTVPAGPVSKFDRFIGHHRHYKPKQLQNLFLEAKFESVKIMRAGFPGIFMIRIATILLGNLFVKSIQKKDFAESILSRSGISLLRLVFRFSLNDSPLGWQLILSARKSVHK